jgi:hypothetical protein
MHRNDIAQRDSSVIPLEGIGSKKHNPIARLGLEFLQLASPLDDLNQTFRHHDPQGS